MTIRTVTPDELEAIAYESGNVVHIGRHEADVRVGDVLFVARLDGAA